MEELTLLFCHLHNACTTKFLKPSGKKSVGGHLAKLEETYNLIEKNQQLIEINQYPLLAEIIREDYETYSREVLERFFKADLMESLHYRAIDSWWDPKGYIDEKGNHQQAKIFEVKRNPDKYRKGLLEQKVEFMTTKEKRLKKYKMDIGRFYVNLLW